MTNNENAGKERGKYVMKEGEYRRNEKNGKKNIQIK